MKKIGITIYNCEKDEAKVFRSLSPRFGVIPEMTSSAVSEDSVRLARGNRCISVGHKSEITEATLFALQKNGVKYISARSVGVNHIDTEAAKNMGIVVGNVNYSPGSVADYTLMLMLMAVRNAKSVVTGAEKFDFRLGAVRGKELRDLTVGVLGTGHIGKAVIERLRGFGCRVLAHSRNPNATANYVPLRDLLKNSDMVTIHVPLDTDTYHMIGSRQMEMMKSGAFIINTSRGGIVDTHALVCALESGHLSGAALDVLEGEEGLFYFDCAQKPIDHPFLVKLKKMPNVIITPHTAYYTERALQDTVEKTIANCLKFERGKMYG